MDTPLGVTAQGFYVPSREAKGHVVHSAERLWDALAVLFIIAGTTLFLLARNGLASIAAGTQVLPPGVTSYVQRADYFSAQSTAGLGIICVGVMVGLSAAVKHAMRRRGLGASTPPAA